jgi:mannitol/fructose-specific phosphotransferase system IIA component (Ntr-type)
MVSPQWLRPGLIFPKLSVGSTADLVHVVSATMEKVGRVPSSRTAAALQESLASKESYSVGRGVALPHAEAVGLTETLVCLVTTRNNLELGSMDGVAPDVFFFILAKPDPRAHLLLLAHLARLCHSRTFLQGLRAAESAEEIVKLVDAVEGRIRLSLPARANLTHGAGELILITVSGEKAVDALLVDLVDQGFGEASIIESQSLREATAHEVPLFAGFRDLFGDPGGRRVLLVESAVEGTEAVVDAVKRVSGEYPDSDPRIIAVPIRTQWMASKQETKNGGT